MWATPVLLPWEVPGHPCRSCFLPALMQDRCHTERKLYFLCSIIFRGMLGPCFLSSLPDVPTHLSHPSLAHVHTLLAHAQRSYCHLLHAQLLAALSSVPLYCPVLPLPRLRVPCGSPPPRVE